MGDSGKSDRILPMAWTTEKNRVWAYTPVLARQCAQVQLFYDLHHKTCKVIGRQPFVDRGWQQVGGFSINGDEAAHVWQSVLRDGAIVCSESMQTQSGKSDRLLGLSFRAVSSRLMAAVADRYELRAWSPAALAVHKRADSVAAASEAVHCIGWPAHEVRDVLGIVHPVLDLDPLAEIYGCRPWEPWAADVAAARFLEALESLRAAVRGQIEAQV